ncbi:ferredoxin hydrogenase [Wolffia australiana]
MPERFSPALRSADLNDFIAPSQACVVSLQGSKSKQEKVQTAVIQPSESKPQKISLTDCLACSGCITSAETVMLEKQSLDEFFSHINAGEDVIVSLSPQSRASLAAHFNLSPPQVLRKLTTLLKDLGVKGVFDTSCSRDISLIESCNEFISRYKQSKMSSGQDNVLAVPMLSSACPGWICYAEKSVGSYVLPYISTVKSPQQAIGTVIKHHLCAQMGLKPENIYHVTVMPCYDKKLEAARQEFIFSVDREGVESRIAEVDSVLTTREILDLIQSRAVDFKSLPEASLDRLLTNVDNEGCLFGVSGGSGGYAETVFVHAAKELFGKEISSPVDFRVLRNADFQEAVLEVDGEVALRFALCYGFRNLQNIVRKIKIGKCDYHFVEIMACPSGCLNGRGQLEPGPGQTVRETIQSVQSAYVQDVAISDPFKNPIVKGIYDEWLRFPGSETANKYMHTSYRAVVKSVASEIHSW